MTILEQELDHYAPALALDAFMPRRARKRALRILRVLVVSFGTIVAVWFCVSWLQEGGTFGMVPEGAHIFVGALFIITALYLGLFALTAFYQSFYFRGAHIVTKEELTDQGGITYDVAKMCALSKGDLTRAFLTGTYGEEILIRLDVSVTDVLSYLDKDRPHLGHESLPILSTSFFTIADLGAYLYEHDPTLKKFFFAHGVTDEYFFGACAWVSRVRILHRASLRWWSRDNLGKRQGIGRELSFGVAYELRQYLRSIQTTSALSVMLTDVVYANEIIEKIETTLVRSKSTNVILVGETGMGKMDILIELGRRMAEGSSVASLTGKRIVVFDTEAFIATHSSKDTFEPAFLSLMTGAEEAGNIIIVIEDIVTFLTSVLSLGTDVSVLMARFLSSKEVQLITTTTPHAFHMTLEINGDLLRNFEPIHLEEPDTSSVIRVLEESVWEQEYRFHVVFTYGSLVRIATCAEQYIVEGVMPEKALNLLTGIASVKGGTLVAPSDVDTYVHERLHIPVGPVRADERELLLNLEDELDARIIGQHDAVLAIASIMRRARAGIQNSKRPLGSFLFLGPTGVGKTETAKALASLFFTSEEHMVRFDMSEFSGGDALIRLIGTGSSPGALASSLREHPYAVLLLDEFEKASSAVHDLFLQVLDEGMFTDGRGARVNARNTIIIATSNAGSAYIWDLVGKGRRPHDAQSEIIESVIAEHIFKPELINRFDATIIFGTLSEDEQRKIASLMVHDLVLRVKKKGYTLMVNDELLSVLMKVGYSKEFGARPMRRAIQDLLEEKIASKIIRGSLHPGDTISFTSADFM